MSEMYDALASIYDELNNDIDYESWADALTSAMVRYAKRPVKTVADIGCGTGSMTIPLAMRGYDMIGVDLSTEMLSAAYQRAYNRGEPLAIQFLQQDMRDLAFIAPVDAIVCTLDGVNHLPGTTALGECFASVAAWLADGGVFLFDLNSRYKFEHIYGDEVYTLETDNAFCVWQNAYDPKGKHCDFYITLFEQTEDGTYLRSDSAEREYFFSIKTIRNSLEKAGLKLVSVVGGLDGHEVNEHDERWYFAAVKG